MDSVTDLFNRIKNAQAVNKKEAIVPFSKLNAEVLRILKESGLIENYTKENRRDGKIFLVVLKYIDKAPVISGFKKISKPGQRIYVAANKIFRVKQGYGISIISTSRGLMTDKEARKQKIGGELLAEVW